MKLSFFTTFSPQHFGLPTQYFWQVYASDGENGAGRVKHAKLCRLKKSVRLRHCFVLWQCQSTAWIEEEERLIIFVISQRR